MTERKCPNCGEIVPSLSVTCPKCYSSVPRNDDVPDMKGPQLRERDEKVPGGKSVLIATLLAAIPGIFGLQGLGRIYLDYRNEKGWLFLVFGAVLFALIYLCIGWWSNADSFTKVLLLLLLVILAMLYISSYLAQLADAYFGSVLKMFRF
ncbi:MAG: hypothetical protein AB7S83_02920 [Candidatus Methanomethylophilaceae archaeon]|jgi:hypothetical protein